MNERREPEAPTSPSLDPGSGSSVGERPVSPDRVLSAVANATRRAVLQSVTNAAGQTLPSDVLVDRVADRVRDEDSKRETDEHRQRVRIALHHAHLPKLEAAGMIEYTDETGDVQFVGGDLEQTLLRLVEPDDSQETAVIE